MRTIKDSPKYEAWLLAAEYLRWVRRGGEKIGLDWSMSATDQDTILDIASDAALAAPTEARSARLPANERAILASFDATLPTYPLPFAGTPRVIPETFCADGSSVRSIHPRRWWPSVEAAP